MKLLSTLYVTEHRAKIAVQKRNLVVHDPERGRVRVPIEFVDAVVLLAQAQVTSQALALCALRGIPVTGLTRGGKVRFAVRGQTNGNVHLRVNQLRTSDDGVACMDVGRWIVAAKLRNSAAVLGRWARDADEPRRSGLLLRLDEVRDKQSRVGGARARRRAAGTRG